MEETNKYEIKLDLERLGAILSSGIFQSANQKHPLLQSAITELLVCLNDLLQKCRAEGKRIDFNDDVNVTDKVKDVTDLINKMRNAACHIPSGDRDFKTERGCGTNMFLVGYGDTSGVIIAGEVLGGIYSDDVFIGYGGHLVYINRHVVRAINEAKQIFCV